MTIPGSDGMAQDMKAVLPLGWHLVTLLRTGFSHRPLVEPRDTLLDSKCSVSELESKLTGLQGVIFFERPNWRPELLPTARRIGLRTVCVPMWEWFCGRSTSMAELRLFCLS